MDKAMIGMLIRYGLTVIGSALASKGLVSTEQGAYLGQNADTLIGIVTALVGVVSGFVHTQTTVAVPKNDPVQAKIVANQIADNNSPGGANR